MNKKSKDNHPELFENMYPPLTTEMKGLIKELQEIVKNPEVVKAFNKAISEVNPVLQDGSNKPNPWLGKTIDYFVSYFENWFTFLPTPTGGLGKIMPFTYFYLDNPSAFHFLNTFESRQNKNEPYSKEIFNWTVKFIKARGKFMDSKESLMYMDSWLDDPSANMNDFIIPKGGFKSFNEFFTRELKKSANPRPISNPENDAIAVASGDTEINFIESDLTLTTPLKVKTRFINVIELLNGSKYAKHFVGGTAVSCVLMPNSYHRYHAPVTGKIVESQEVQGIYNGIMDGEDWFNKGDIGESTTDFSIFEDFHRSYFIMETSQYGYVALIPVGLNTISAMFPSLVNKKSTLVPPGSPAVPIKKGDELGYFAYGGSLNMLMFQKGVFSSVSVLMGQRLGEMKPIIK
ncbi:phosphatidylserine decarboxylase [Formosa maritima]|uniref:Phosphatidylserine decarboxylase n=1 Tax=Formosa maritima TaxID=2592046 RepID=A0A5D0G0W0_9FLAO|nr:phosphatidylserine decarboxylase [Formosa maritima]TYA52468.1 phosphatidylserine decarboxylase [Formosa maritima]